MTQYRFLGGDMSNPGPWRDTMDKAILDVLAAGFTCATDRIEMRVTEPEPPLIYEHLREA